MASALSQINVNVFPDTLKPSIIPTNVYQSVNSIARMENAFNRMFVNAMMVSELKPILSIFIIHQTICELFTGYEIGSIFSCTLAQPSISVCSDCEERICIDDLCIEPTGMRSEAKFDDAFDGFDEFADGLADEIDEVMEEVLEKQVLPVLESFSESEEVSIVTNDLDSEQEESREFMEKCIETTNCICQQIPSLICVNGVCDLPTNCNCVDGFQKQEDGQCVSIASTTAPVIVQQASQS